MWTFLSSLTCLRVSADLERMLAEGILLCFSQDHLKNTLLLKWVSSLQGGEYGTDEEEEDDEEVSPPYPSAIEVFDLAENEDLSPLETDPEKLAHKYKEVRKHLLYWIVFLFNHS